MGLRRNGIPALAACAALAAGSAWAAPPTDPSAGGQEPLTIMRVGEALDHVGPQLADVSVATLDTGVDLDHPDLAPRLFSLPAPVPAPDPDGTHNDTVAAGAPGWDLLGTLDPPNLVPDSDPSDPAAPDGGHGTSVAGILGAAWNNGQGGAGVAPNARLMALRTCWEDDQCYQYVQASAINWAADRGARVVSMSWLSGAIENGFRDSITTHPNVLFVAIPSGNGGATDIEGDAPMPCTVDSANVLCVTTSSPTDGLDCGGYGAQAVDVAVPTRNGIATTNGGGFSSTGCATSWAAPTAAGIATILFGIDPTATAADVRSAIVDSARKVPAFDGKSVSGGVIDAVAAVDLFQSRRGIAGRTPPPPPPPPELPAPPAPEPVPAGPDRTAPSLLLSLSPARFRAGGTGARLARGTTFRVTLSEGATVLIKVQRALPGRRAGSRCVPPRRSNRRAKACTRWKTLGTISRALATGRSAIRFAGLDRRRHKLPPGRYRAVATARDAVGNASLSRTVGFRIVR